MSTVSTNVSDGNFSTLKQQITDVRPIVIKSPNKLDSEMTLNDIRSSFKQYSKVAYDGNMYMTKADFIAAITLPSEAYYRKFKKEDFGILFEVADSNGDGLIGIDDWLTFHNLLQKPSFEYQVIFKLFDSNSDGTVSFETLKRIFTQYRDPKAIDFDFNSSWLDLYMGKKRSRHQMTYSEFAQMLHGMLGERVRQAFQKYDSNGDGYITPSEFAEIISNLYAHKLSDHLLENLQSLCNVIPGNKISYSTMRAFQNVVNSFDIVSEIVKASVKSSPSKTITKTDFINEAARCYQRNVFAPLEIEILFHFAGLDNPSGMLTLSDFERVMDSSWQHFQHDQSEYNNAATFEERHGFLWQVLESVYHFGLGAIAGGIGATAVYPIDLVKTRMQNQRSKIVGQLLYRNSWDCFRKVLRNEGSLGLYSGLLPQLLGVAPEKAIKLTVNDFIRGKTRNADGHIPMGMEILAGGTAGGCQVIVTNPLEVVKIQLQVRGQMQSGLDVTNTGKAANISAWSIVKSLGLFGLYKGAVACLLRDIPFSAIYFPTYAHLKKDLYGERPGHKLTIPQLLISGAIAGMPAAYLTTPADVIKTRLQVKARDGETTYLNIRHAFKTILQEEGIKAFFKGGLARVLRSSPQFGVTLASYEALQSFIPMPGHKSAELSVPSQIEDKDSMPISFIRARNALSILNDLGVRLGDYSRPISKI